MEELKDAEVELEFKKYIAPYWLNILQSGFSLNINLMFKLKFGIYQSVRNFLPLLLLLLPPPLLLPPLLCFPKNLNNSLDSSIISFLGIPPRMVAFVRVYDHNLHWSSLQLFRVLEAFFTMSGPYFFYVDLFSLYLSSLWELPCYEPSSWN